MKVTFEYFQQWLDDEQLIRFAHSAGRKGKKTLYAKLGGGYEVHQNGVCVHKTMQPFDAVEKFNSIDI